MRPFRNWNHLEIETFKKLRLSRTISSWHFKSWKLKQTSSNWNWIDPCLNKDKIGAIHKEKKIGLNYLVMYLKYGFCGQNSILILFSKHCTFCAHVQKLWILYFLTVLLLQSKEGPTIWLWICSTFKVTSFCSGFNSNKTRKPFRLHSTRLCNSWQLSENCLKVS